MLDTPIESLAPRKRKLSRSKSRRRFNRRLRNCFVLTVLLAPLLYLYLRGLPPALVGYRDIAHCTSAFAKKPPGSAKNYHIPAHLGGAARHGERAPRNSSGADEGAADDVDGVVVVENADVYNYAARLAQLSPDSWLIDVGTGGAAQASRLYTELPELRVAALDVTEKELDAARRRFEKTDRYPAQNGAGSYFAEWDGNAAAFPELGMPRLRRATIVAAGVLEVVGNPDRVVDALLPLLACGAENIIVASVNRPTAVAGGPLRQPGGNRLREWSMSELEAYLTSRGASVAECRLVHRTNLDRYNNLPPTMSTCLISRDSSKRFPAISHLPNLFPIDRAQLAKIEEDKAKAAEERKRRLAAELAERLAKKTVNYWARTFKRKSAGKAYNYSLPNTYVTGDTPPYFADTFNGVNGVNNVVVWQADAYNYAAHVAAETSGSWLIDVGGGNGYKLSQIYDNSPTQQVVLIDYGSNLNRSRANFANTRRYNASKGDGVVFAEWNLDNATLPEVGLERVRNATIMAADVIEHLDNPDNLVDGLLALLYGAGAKNLIISTVGKNPGAGSQGPPQTPYHVREWSLEELQAYIKSRGAHSVNCIVSHSSNLFRFKNFEKRISTCLVSRNDSKQLPPFEQIRDYFPLNETGYAEVQVTEAKAEVSRRAKAAAEAMDKAKELAAAAELAKNAEKVKMKAVEEIKVRTSSGQGKSNLEMGKQDVDKK